MYKEKILLKLKKLLENNYVIFFLISIVVISILIQNFLILFLTSFLLLFNYFIFKFFFGKNFIYFFKNYFLIDDIKYGYKLKPDTNSKNVKPFIFDRFIYSNYNNNLNEIENYTNEKRKYLNVDKNGYRLNSNSYQINKDKKKLKIFCSGGSTTFGSFLNNNETWPAILERQLIINGINSEVINGGVPGWSSGNEIIRLKNEIENIKPDIIILHQGWNDEFIFSELNNYNFLKKNQLRGTESALHFHVSKNLQIFKYNPILFMIMKKYFSKKFSNNIDFKNKKRWETLLFKKYFEIWQNNLLEFRKISDEYQIKLYITDYPCLVDFFDSKSTRDYLVKNSRLDFDYAQYQAISKLLISTFIRNQNYAKPIDLGDYHLKISAEDKLKYFFDEIHLTNKGNIFLSNVISKEILKDLNKNFNNIYQNKNDKKSIDFNLLIQSKYQFIDYFIKKKIVEKHLDSNSLTKDQISTFNYTLN